MLCCCCVRAVLCCAAAHALLRFPVNITILVPSGCTIDMFIDRCELPICHSDFQRCHHEMTMFYHEVTYTKLSTPRCVFRCQKIVLEEPYALPTAQWRSMRELCGVLDGYFSTSELYVRTVVAAEKTPIPQSVVKRLQTEMACQGFLLNIELVCCSVELGRGWLD